MTKGRNWILVCIACIFLCLACNRHQKPLVFDNGAQTFAMGASSYSGEYHEAAALIAENRFQDALVIYQGLLQKEEPSNLQTVNIAIAAVYSLMQQYDLALQYSQIAWRLDSTTAIANESLGGASAGVGNYPAAIQYSTRAALMDPQNSTPRYWLAESYYHLGNEDSAMHHAKAFIALDPESVSRPNIDQIIRYYEAKPD